jgi:LPXTG-motif cell wall-anchored protein
MAGIRFVNGVNGQTIDNATVGVLRLMPNAQVTMELGSGYSMGIDNASNIDLQNSSSLKVTTSKMALTGSNRVVYRYAPLVGLGNNLQKSTNTVKVGENAVLSIIRTGVERSDSPLIGMGPYGSPSNSSSTYHFEVDGGSLDLEDSAYSNYLPETYSLKYDNSKSNGWPALLTMWGTSSFDYINFNNAKLINLQRKQGYLIKTEGAENGNDGQNHIVINSKDSNYNTPLTIIPAGQTTPVTWNIKYLSNTSQGGNYALAFRKVATWNTNGSEYMNGSINTTHGVNEVELTPNASDPGSNSFSNGKVVADANDTTASNALNDFINHFSWWNTSGVKFGSELALKNQYTVSYKTVNVEQGKSATTDPSFIGADGKDTTKPAGTTFALDSDAPEWASVNPTTGKVTVTPGTDVTVDEYNIPVTVTYPDGSTKEVHIQVNVGPKTKDAAEYTPSYAPVNVEPGQTATTTPKFTDADGKPVTTIPAGTKFETGSDSPTWASVNPTTGKMTVTPARDVTPGAYNIPVTVTYPDNSTDETTIPVIVTKAGQTVTWGDNGAIVTTVDPSNVKAHETTENSQVVPVSDVKVIVEGYKLTNGKLETTKTPITVDSNTVSWKFAPSTNVGKATAYEDITNNKINIDLTNNTDAQAILGTKTGIVTTNPFTIHATGADAKTVTTPVEVKLDSALTGDQFNKLVDNNIPTEQIKNTSWLTKPDKDGKGGVIKITFTDKDANGHQTYLNIDIPASSLKMTTDADSYSPSYTPITVEPGKTVTTSPTFTGITGVPAGTTFKTNTDAPTWASVDPTKGTVTVSPTADVTPGAYNIPVTVTYQDGTTDETNVPVIVTKTGQMVTWGDNGAVVTTVDPSKVKAHKTSDKSQVVPVSDVKVTAEGYKLTNGVLGTKPTSITVDPSTVSWEKAPNTVVDTATADENTISGNKVAIDLSNNADAQAILGSKNGKLTTNSFDIAANGAGAKAVTTPVEVKLNSNLTDDQFNALVDNNIPTEQIESTTWGTKPNKDGNNGVIKIAFKDKDADGNPTYLNVNIPSGSLKMTTDADEYTPESQDISTTQGTLPAADKTITNKPTDNVPNKLPDGTTIAWADQNQAQADVNTPGEHEEDITVTYPDGSTENVTITVNVEAKTKDSDKYTPESQDISTTQGTVPGASSAITNKSTDDAANKLPEGTIINWTDPNKVQTDVNTPGEHEEDITVTYPDNSIDSVTIKVIAKAEPVTKPIKVTVGQTPDAKDGISNLNNGGNTSVPGYPSGAHWFNDVAPDTSTTGQTSGTAVVTYPDGSTENVTIPVNVVAKTTDADKYTPSYTSVNVKPGQIATTTPKFTDPDGKVVTVPTGTAFAPGTDIPTWATVDPSNGTVTLKPGTNVSPGNYNIPITVTYPDGSNDNASATVHISNSTTTTDADKYTPEGQTINVIKGQTPDPANGIKNKGNLPEGTSYAWKDGTPDTTTPGNKSAVVVVTYPDSSKEEVPVTIQVTNPVTPTDADQNNPEAQDVQTTVGKVPDPSSGIANKDKLPNGTKYTWQTTPDTSTTGNHPAEILVTYPDGSHDQVSVNIVVKSNSTNEDKAKKLAEHKSTAADEINQAAKGKKSKIDHMKISDQEKSKLKDLVDQKAADAIKEISNAKSLDEVNTARTAGLKEIESVAPNSSDLPDRPKAKKNSKNRHGKGANVNGQNGNAGFSANVHASALAASNKNNKGALPQTGENESNLGLVGLAIASLGALLGLAISRKRKN